MHIKSGNILIRNATPNDAATLCNWWNDGAVMAHAGFPNGLGTSESAISAGLANGSDRTGRVHIIEIDGAAIGEMNYRRVEGNTAEIGIKICKASHQNKGYGTALLSMFIDGLFNNLAFEKIVLDTNSENKRARHVYEKLGFRLVRVNADAWKNQLGELQSSVDYELTPTLFALRKNTAVAATPSANSDMFITNGSTRETLDSHPPM